MPLAEMNTAYIGVGSNLEDKLHNCCKAIELVDNIENCTVMKQSGFYRTEPVGVASQDWYVNGVIRVETGLSAQDLLRSLLSIETGMGRVRKQRWESRIIDLDILLYEHHVIDEKNLTIPHPLMHTRRFVLMPMVQLDPDLIHPVLGRTMSELFDDLAEEGQGVMPIGRA
ncbi:MAG: 2-amino-4-hydroxy-6-hydroxymethyldihydropteridine diphosphokinase [Desulfobacteraceae bacterium]|nr:2-amino-4-hydroxy-6-hydroxymethyldihydropteridine diphosphokinase [Desulfobacteraceae bacterium]